MASVKNFRQIIIGWLPDYSGPITEQAKDDIVGTIVQELSEAGIPESQLDAILRGEAVVVPREPTKMMVVSGSVVPAERSVFDYVADVYRTMLQASQEPSK